MNVLWPFLLYGMFGITYIDANCGKNYGGCDKTNGLCWPSTGSDNKVTSFCSCKSGYKFLLSIRRGKCKDINECTSGLHDCDTVNGKCINTVGSYSCKCKAGYVLDYTKTKCLDKTKIYGDCGIYSGKKKAGKTKSFDSEEESALAKFLGFLRDTRNRREKEFEESEDIESDEISVDDTESRIDEDGDNVLVYKGEHDHLTKALKGATCEAGYQIKPGCIFCQDIDECKTGKSKCDLVHGSCHNTIGGYFCTCKTGYGVGPCGYKCFLHTQVPAKCTEKNLTVNQLINADSDGLNNEVTRDQILTFNSEKALSSGKQLTPIKLYYRQPCTTLGSTKVQTLDLNNDKKTDITITYVCVSSGTKVYKIKSVYDKQGKWNSWTTWTACKPTIWGGVQTRARICKNGLVGYGKCLGSASAYRECYCGKKEALRVRRNAEKLTITQKKDLVQAMTKYKKDISTYGFHHAAGTHFWPNQCFKSNGVSGACCYHGAKVNFVMWHRAELLNFEQGLTRHLNDKKLGLPYWDWLVYPNPPTLAWASKFEGKTNPFNGSQIRYDLSPVISVARSPSVSKNSVATAKSIFQTVTANLAKSHMIHEYSESLESSHNNIHVAVCHVEDSCAYSMGNLAYAAFDPIFFFHHTNVDRLFSIFQAHMHKKKDMAWTRQALLEPSENIYHFNQPYQPFHNRTLTPFKRVQKTSSIADLLYYKQLLGYRYDNLTANNTKLNVKDIITEKSHLPSISNTVLLAQYEKSTGVNVKMRYFYAGGTTTLEPCSSLANSNQTYLGSLIVLGSKKERKWHAKQPALLDITNKLAALEVTATSNIKIKTCYTNEVACQSKCKSISTTVSKKIPSPQIIFYPSSVDVDIIKFRWDVGYRMPLWKINFNAGKQYIYFWGGEAKNVVQVAKGCYDSCSASGGKTVNCPYGCALSAGSHFFINKKSSNCKAGMKLQVLSVI